MTKLRNRGRWILGVQAAAALLVVAVEATPQNKDLLPEPDFLEFLGSWETSDGEWADPFQVDDASDLELKGKPVDHRSRDGRQEREQPRTESRPQGASSAPSSPGAQQGGSP